METIMIDFTMNEQEENLVDILAERCVDEIRFDGIDNYQKYLEQLPTQRLKEIFTITVNMMLLIDYLGKDKKSLDAPNLIFSHG